MLPHALLEHYVDRHAAIWRVDQNSATFTGYDVGMQRHYVSTSDEGEPGHPGSAHAVAQMQRMESIPTNESVDPPTLCESHPVGLRVILKHQHPLPVVIEHLPGDGLMRFVASSHWVVTALCDEEVDWVGDERPDGLQE